MEQRLQTIFALIPAAELHAIVQAIVGEGARMLSIAYDEIRKPHADPRTIGIVRVSGTAETGQSVRDWSCVTKFIDLSEANTLGTTVDPRNEVLVYKRGYFQGGSSGLRPALCYHVSEPRAGLTILWLEDLTGAEGAPFDVAQLTEMAGHLGRWNAEMAAHPPELDFAIGQDYFIAAAAKFNFPARLATMRDLSDEPLVQQMFARQPLDVADDYVATYLELIRGAVSLPHALSLADCPVSNFFHRPGETIAIDWAGLASQPVGADGGRFIGSALTWGRRFIEIAVRERELFDVYLEGLRRGGAAEDRDVVRRGYLCEMGFYLCTTATLPEMVANPRSTLSIEFFEKRLGMPAAEFGEALAPMMDLLPSYTAEIRALLG
jgi:hypothetical protein